MIGHDLYIALPELFVALSAMALLMFGVFRGNRATHLVLVASGTPIRLTMNTGLMRLTMFWVWGRSIITVNKKKWKKTDTTSIWLKSMTGNCVDLIGWVRSSSRYSGPRRGEWWP